MNPFIDTLIYLLPEGGWSVRDDDFNKIVYDEGVTPIDKKVFDETFKKIESIKAAQIKAKQNTRNQILNRLGITAEEAALLLG